MKPKLTLVGAGPGDPDLISIKGIKALKNADVVLYDALVHRDLLKYIPAKAIKIFVGKRAGRHTYSQDEINKLIVEYAFSYGNVVRLKGGDPFIFARGHEEVQYAEAFGIDVDVVPGISSINLPGLQGIPLTKRGINESFWVITGTTSSGEISKDLIYAARSTATIVILMGLNKINEIAEIFIKANKGNKPVAVIQNGSLPSEKIAVGTISTIADVIQKMKIVSPALIVVGEVVRLHKSFNYEYVKTESGVNY